MKITILMYRLQSASYSKQRHAWGVVGAGPEVDVTLLPTAACCCCCCCAAAKVMVAAAPLPAAAAAAC